MDPSHPTQASPSTSRWSSLSVAEILGRLEQASDPQDVKRVLSHSDEQLLAQAWVLLDPVQRGALLLTRAFRGASILRDESHDEPAEPADPAGPGEETD